MTQFQEKQMVTIHSTDELPTAHDGDKGEVWGKAIGQHPDFYKVLVWGPGEVHVFHESQLAPLLDVHIRQITSAVVCGADRVGKWFCSVSIPGPDGDPIIRYLQGDGTWGKVTFYFDTQPQLQLELDKGSRPDFTLSERDLCDRAMIRDDLERMMEEDSEDRFAY